MNKLFSQRWFSRRSRFGTFLSVMLSALIAIAAIVTVLSASSANSLPVPTPTGLVIKASPHSVEETERRFTETLETRGISVFTTVNHSQNAANAELSLRPTTVVIFGNPKLGTPLMQCAQSLAIDLPQKLLIWEDETRQVQVAYNDPRYLGGRHRLGGCGNQVIQQIAGALDNLSGAAIAP